MDTTTKNAVLSDLVALLESNRSAILEANALDVLSCGKEDESLLDRLYVDEKKVSGMIKSVLEAIDISDPENQILYTYDHPNGMHVTNKVVPFGTVLIIYESRPDVTIEAAIIAFKAGNKILLKGGKEARHTNLRLTNLWHQALTRHNQSLDWVKYLDIGRKEIQEMISSQSHHIDLIIPRGGEGLIEFVRQNTRIPIIISGRGNNFLYIDKSADLKMATDIIINGKSRISVCNALDKVLINRDIDNFNDVVESLISSLVSNDLQVLTFGSLTSANQSVSHHNDSQIWKEEFLSTKIMLATVDGLEDAVALINEHSGGHSATIVSADMDNVERFQKEVDCAAVYHNASTRFTDGGQFGFSAEIAISTQKLHFRGPIGIHQLVSNKWYISGKGNIR